ncbi:MAG: OmpA family protein [Bacteroidota bacterium]|nr:OmpA family protein [Bacteroidota bacterium]MDP4214784.1 OmpA family protein [Bacteroidota bacterium]MDP4245498.1 OmpA family protein [Bacteroidota bacterium]MDP4256837.1 OmpA family protein [Bacteroidota bacterium]
MKNHILLLLLPVLMAGFTTQAQYNPEKVSKKAGQYHSKALELADGDDYPGAIQALRQAIAIDSNFEDAYLSLAGMYGQLKNYPEAIRNYEKAKSIDSNYFLDFNLPYSIDLAGVGAFQKALQAVNLFLTISNLNETSRKAGDYRKACYTFALNYAATNPSRDYKFEPLNLGDSVNSEVSEYYPTVTIDGSKLIFTRRVNHLNEDFYESDRIGGHWEKARSLPGNINTNMNEGAQNISQDGQWLIFTGCNFPDGLGSCDLYISYLTPDGWSTPENLGETINTEFWESAPSLSPDKRDLYFTSSRPGGYGGNDLYVSHRMLNGKWTQPENLGPEINTVGNESAPFIHADNQSLYFTSDGHPGYGGDDLFVSRKGPKGTWGKPENLGYPINTIENEGSLVVAADGKTAYYASDRADSRGGLDLYTFELRSDVRPAQTLWVQGKVFDKTTHKGLPSSVELTDLSTQEPVSKLQTDETGNYLITLPKGKDYAFHVNRKGYMLFSENFPLSKEQGDTAYNMDIPLQPIEANAVVILKNIFYETNRYDLKPESRAELDEIVQFMRDNPAIKIQINGHTDNSGKQAENLKLSEARARSVTTYLLSKGIPQLRLSYKGWGDTQPVADNSTPGGRALNRRTELKIISR